MQPWYSFIYLYAVGGLLFGLAIFCGVKKRVLKLERKTDRRILYGMLGAYLFYFCIQGVWNILALMSGQGL